MATRLCTTELRRSVLPCLLLPAVLLAVLLTVLLTVAPGPAAGQDEPWRYRGIFKLSTLASRATQGDYGYVHQGDDTRMATEQLFRLQLKAAPAEWLRAELDYLNIMQNNDGQPAAAGAAGAALFRRTPGSRWLERPADDPDDPLAPPSQQQVWWRHEIDRAWLRLGFAGWEAVAGRQPISFGAGRIWQPTDLFAAFSPLDLDREYKPGVDAMLVRAYPGAFSELTAVWVASPRAPGPDGERVNDSAALHFKALLGGNTELSLLGASVREVGVAGGSLETTWLAAGWLLEGARFSYEDSSGETRAESVYVAGVNFGLSSGVVLVAELYRNTMGADNEDELLQVALSPPYQEGRLPQLSSTVLGLGGNGELGGLWRWSYSLFASALPDSEGSRHSSLLHQGALFYSLSDEGEAVFSLMHGTGRGMEDLGLFAVPRSEFGHLPTSFFLSVKFVL